MSLLQPYWLKHEFITTMRITWLKKTPLGHNKAYNMKNRFQLEQSQYLKKPCLPMHEYAISNASRLVPYQLGYGVPGVWDRFVTSLRV